MVVHTVESSSNVSQCLAMNGLCCGYYDLQLQLPHIQFSAISLFLLSVSLSFEKIIKLPNNGNHGRNPLVGGSAINQKAEDGLFE